MPQAWMVKNKQEQISGPHTTEEMIGFIEQGELTGEESVSEHPINKWKPLSQWTDFYEALLLAVKQPSHKSTSFLSPQNDETKDPKPSEQSSPESLPLVDKTIALETPSPSIEEDSQPIEAKEMSDPDILFEDQQDQSDQSEFEPTLVAQNDFSELSLEKEAPYVEPPSFDKLWSSSDSKTKDQFEESPPETVQQSLSLSKNTSLPAMPLPPSMPPKSKNQHLKKRRSKIPRLLFLCFFLSMCFFLLEEDSEDKPEKNQTTLLFPNQFAISNLSQSDLQKRFQEASRYFYKDTYKNYLKAQELLINLAEEASDVPEILALLCLTHRELWPYSQQTLEDQVAVSQVAQRMSKVQAIGVHQDVCHIVKYLLSHQIKTATAIIDKSLKEHPENPVLYDLKAEIFANNKEYNDAVAYVQNAQRFWSPWLKLYVKEAEYNMANGEFLDAMTVLKKMQASYPSHILSSVLLGYIYLTVFKRAEEGASLISKGLQAHELVPPMIYSQVTLALAKYYKSQNKQQHALEFAQKSYQSNLSNSSARALVLELGGEKALEVIQKKDQQIMALGDFFYKQDNFLAAQAQYKAAYEQNRRNGLAALKAGQALWRLNLKYESIEWVKKAMNSDPKLTEAYVTLSDYLSQQYQFDSAMGVLMRLAQRTAQGYEFLKAMALLHFRQRNYKTSVSFARKALKIYDTDIDVNLLLSEGLYHLKEYQEAYQIIAKTLQIAGDNVKIQGVYGKVMAAFQGRDLGVKYMQQLVNTYSHNLQYHIALAEIYIDHEEHEQALKVLEPVLETLQQSQKKLNLKDITKIQVINDMKKTQLLLGKIYVIKKDYHHALQAHIQAALTDPSDALPLFRMALLYMDLQKYDQAIYQFKRVLRINPKYPKAQFYMGTAALHLGRSEFALAAAKKEKQINPSLSEPYTLTGKIYMKAGHYDKAIVELQRAIKIQPQGSQIYILLAKAYRLSNNFDLAEKMISQAQTLEKNNPSIYKEKGEIFEGKGQIHRAIGAYDLYIKLSPNTYDRQVIESKILQLSQQ